jgi:hypothetical protein
MYKKIDVYVNGVYQYSTNKYKTCRDAIKDARATKHILIASIPNRYLTIYDYDTVTARISK